eukprot:XP_014071957.1 PREDICTED: growth hormone-inducible transmembrane protein-like [Salmo salar]
MTMLVRLACLRSLPVSGLRPMLTQGSPALRSSTLKSCLPLKVHQGYSTKSRFGFRGGKTAKDQLQQAAFQPATDTAIRMDNMGRMFLAGGAAVGLGALCYYGLGMSNEIGAIERAV